MFRNILLLGCFLLLWSCKNEDQHVPTISHKQLDSPMDYYDFAKGPKSKIDSLNAKYTTFKLETDLSGLTPNEKEMIPLLIDAAKIMDDLFWEQAYGSKESFINKIENQSEKAFALIK